MESYKMYIKKKIRTIFSFFTTVGIAILDTDKFNVFSCIWFKTISPNNIGFWKKVKTRLDEQYNSLWYNFDVTSPHNEYAKKFLSKAIYSYIHWTFNLNLFLIL